MKCTITDLEGVGFDGLITSMQQEVLSLRATIKTMQDSIGIIKEQQPSIKLSDSFGEDDDGYHLSYYDYLLQCNENGNLSRFAEILNELGSKELVHLLRTCQNDFRERYLMEIHKKILIRLDKGGSYE